MLLDVQQQKKLVKIPYLQINFDTNNSGQKDVRFHETLPVVFDTDRISRCRIQNKAEEGRLKQQKKASSSLGGNEATLETSKSCIMEKDLKDHLSPLLLLHLSSYLITFFLRLVCTSSEIRNARGQGTLQDYLFINNIPCERNELTSLERVRSKKKYMF